jgi:hypothetical protein
VNEGGLIFFFSPFTLHLSLFLLVRSGDKSGEYLTTRVCIALSFV